MALNFSLREIYKVYSEREDNTYVKEIKKDFSWLDDY